LEHPKEKVKRQGDLDTAAKNAIRDRFGRKCAICGQFAIEVDHIVEMAEFAPEDKWRANLPSNLQLLCFQHHAEKTAKYRRDKIVLDDPDDTSTSARNRKKKRRRKNGIYY
jgi:5-methylcytosine-specific restriction endonuclease McrA